MEAETGHARLESMRQVHRALRVTFSRYEILEPFCVLGPPQAYSRRTYGGALEVEGQRIELVFKTCSSDRWLQGATQSLRSEAAALSLCADENVRVPEILALGSSQDWILMNRIPGRSLAEVLDSQHTLKRQRNNLLGAAAELLASIHSAAVPDQVFEQVSDSDRLGRLAGNARALGYPNGLVALALAQLETSLPRQMGLVLSHGDYCAANLLVDADQKLWALDWEDVRLATAEADLSFAIGDTNDLCRDQSEAEFFVSAYEQLRGEPVRNLDWHQVFSAVEQTVNALSLGAPFEHHLTSLERLLM